MKSITFLFLMGLSFICSNTVAQINAATVCVGKWMGIRTYYINKRNPFEVSFAKPRMKRLLLGSRFESNEHHYASFSLPSNKHISFQNLMWRVGSDSSTIMIETPIGTPKKQKHQMSVRILEKDGKTFFIVDELAEVEVRRMVR